MQDVLITAIGTYGQGRLELAADTIRIVRGRHVVTIPIEQISAVGFQPATPWRNGYIYFEAPDAAADVGARAVRFVRRQQAPFDQIKHTLEQRLGQLPAEHPSPLHERTVAVGTDEGAVGHTTETPAIEIDQPASTAPDELLVARLAELGELARTMLQDPRRRDASTFADTVSHAHSELVRMQSWLQAAMDAGPQLGPVHEHVTRIARILTTVADDRLKEASGSQQSRGLRSRAAVDHMHENLEQSIRNQVCAGSLLTVDEVLATSGCEGTVRENLSRSEMFDTVMRSWPVLIEQLHTAGQGQGLRVTEALESLFPTVADGLQNLNGALEVRTQALRTVSSEERVMGDEYLLQCAQICWKDGVTSLGTARETYIRARDRWNARVREIIDSAAATLTDLICGQAAICLFDAYTVGVGEASEEPLSPAFAAMDVIGQSHSRSAPFQSGPPQSESPRFCYNCGATMRPGAKFCVSCGVSLLET